MRILQMEKSMSRRTWLAFLSFTFPSSNEFTLHHLLPHWLPARVISSELCSPAMCMCLCTCAYVCVCVFLSLSFCISLFMRYLLTELTRFLHMNPSHTLEETVCFSRVVENGYRKPHLLESLASPKSLLRCYRIFIHYSRNRLTDHRGKNLCSKQCVKLYHQADHVKWMHFEWR